MRPTKPTLKLVCDFSECSTAEALEYAKELVEKARETGAVVEAKLSLPKSSVDLS